MSVRGKILIILVALLTLLVIVGSYIAWRAVGLSHTFKTEMPPAVQAISDVAYLDSLSQIIHYYDEVLTQSARNYTFTGDVKWKTRYTEAAPKLDTAIEDVIAKGSVADKQIFTSIDTANVALTAMEENAIRLVDQGDKAQAQAVLDSSDYAAQKKIYQDGLNQYLDQRNTKSDEVISLSTSSVQKIDNEAEIEANIVTWSIIILISGGLILFILLYYVIANSVLKPLKKFETAAKEIAQGNFDQDIKVSTHDEIGLLSNTFNKMAHELKESRKDIEKKVADRTKDLTKLNQFMIGRELKMVELKKEINRLKSLNK
jgi:HAMP domain-containing protein